MLSPSDRQELLAIVRAAITARVTGASYIPAPPTGSLAEYRGAFVTIHHRAELRGCLGYTERDRPLAEVVARAAASAASDDPRFPPITPAEMPEILVEISVLGPMQPVATPVEIEVGRHGLMVADETCRGLLLPQVATEWGWDRDTFLAQTCLKAGLRPDAWRSGARVFKFEAEVFGEA